MVLVLGRQHFNIPCWASCLSWIQRLQTLGNNCLEMSTRYSGVSGQEGRALWRRKKKHCSFHHSPMSTFPPDFVSMQLSCFCYSVKRVILSRVSDYREIAMGAPINEHWNEGGQAHGFPECPPALWLTESCMRGKRSQREQSRGALHPHPRLPLPSPSIH